MSNILEAIHSLEDKLQTLLSNYEFLKKENEILLQNTTNFQQKILEQQQFIVDQKRAFDVLKVAKAIDGSGTNTRDTKLKINTLIREIDKCIIQLQD
jgi:peptidoglycan hydrolase CwlO-like protein